MVGKKFPWIFSTAGAFVSRLLSKGCDPIPSIPPIQALQKLHKAPKALHVLYFLTPDDPGSHKRIVRSYIV